MGVPITIFGVLNLEQFEVIGDLRPKVNGKDLYHRVIIRHLHPKHPEYIDIIDWIRKTGTVEAIEDLVIRKSQEEDNPPKTILII